MGSSKRVGKRSKQSKQVAFGAVRSVGAAFALALLAASPLAAGCSADAGDEASDESSDALVTGLSATSITTRAAFEALSTEGGGFGQAGRTVKFLIDARNPRAPKLHFINGNFKERGEVPEYAQFHYLFAQKQLGVTDDNLTFNESTYFTQSKRFFAGTLQTYDLAKAGEAPKMVYAAQFYPDDVIAEGTLVKALSLVTAAFKVPGAQMAFVATGPQQTVKTISADLKKLKVQALTIDGILGAVNYLPMNSGDAWGFLQVFPEDVGGLRPIDIPVFEELPLDLAVVAGTITKSFQDSTSHVNLKSKERNTPNMVLRDASKTHPELVAFDKKPVHLKVGKAGYVLEETTEAKVLEKLHERTNKPWIQLPAVSEKNVLDYDDMCPELGEECLKMGSRYGSKAANLGFLANSEVLGRKDTRGTLSADMGYDLTPYGFGIPVQFYRDFVAAPENAELKVAVDDLITKEKTGTLSPNDRRTMVKRVQDLFYKGRVPAAQLEAIDQHVQALKKKFPNVEKLKVRSSANAEDIPNFDGAGLHDSFGVKLSSEDKPDFACRIETDGTGPATKLEVKPKTIQCAVKAVYASLWNDRAISERSFARLDHATAAMGLSVVPAYDTEGEVAANGVSITRVVNAPDIIGYTHAIQAGNNLVTNPDPGTLAQTTVATFADEKRVPRFTISRFATPEAGKPALTRSVLGTDEAKVQKTMIDITKIVKTVEVAYCNAKPGYYDGDCRFVWLDQRKERSLDMEWKLLDNGEFVLKQAREFHGK
ncbi:MAG: PEP/pyruvate-binding domain-containing protein [Polyangiaceae bacterium]